MTVRVLVGDKGLAREYGINKIKDTMNYNLLRYSEGDICRHEVEAKLRPYREIIARHGIPWMHTANMPPFFVENLVRS
jgi:hypothetical protein